jgi:hypothetical protein
MQSICAGLRVSPLWWYTGETPRFRCVVKSGVCIGSQPGDLSFPDRGSAISWRKPGGDSRAVRDAMRGRTHMFGAGRASGGRSRIRTAGRNTRSPAPLGAGVPAGEIRAGQIPIARRDGWIPLRDAARPRSKFYKIWSYTKHMRSSLLCDTCPA